MAHHSTARSGPSRGVQRVFAMAGRTFPLPPRSTPPRANAAANDPATVIAQLQTTFGEFMDRHNAELRDVQATTDDHAQRLAAITLGAGSDYAGAQVESMGAQFVRASGDQLRALASHSKGSISLNINAVTSAPASGGALVVPDRDAAALLPRRRMTIRDLLPVVSIDSGSVEYAEQTGRPLGARAVQEGVLKPESTMAFTLRTTKAQVIAHWIKASRQVLEDSRQLADVIDTEMRYGLALAEEMLILNGDGVDPNLSGLILNATPFSAAFVVPGANMIDTIGMAMLQAALADQPADGVVVHPADWVRMRLLKDASGAYILGDPQAAVPPSLFGKPLIPTQAIAPDKFLVGSFAAAATLYDRWVPRLEVGYAGDDFTRNMVTILAEERIALAVRQREALVYGDFGNIAPTP